MGSCAQRNATPYYFITDIFSHYNKGGSSSSAVTPLTPVTIISEDRTTDPFLKCTPMTGMLPHAVQLPSNPPRRGVMSHLLEFI